MAKRPVVRIGLLGLGTVGQGVWKHLHASRDRLEGRLGVRLEIAAVAVRDLQRRRAVRIPKARLTTDVLAVATDPRLDIICELMGGTGMAREATLAALRLGKVVVTANKSLICAHGAELFATANEHGGHYFFEASVGGGIPVIKAIREGLVANRFVSIRGILNGTCNYILTRMEQDGTEYAAAVEGARRLGYVEADPSLDLDGWDTAHKTIILAYLAHGQWVPLAQVPVQGISRIEASDIAYARSLGYKIKLLGLIERDPQTQTVAVQVQPTLLPRHSILGSVDDVFNGVSIVGDVAGETTLIGRGAGMDATASAVLSDIADAVVALRGGPPPVVSEENPEAYAALAREVQLTPPEARRGRFYLRLTVADRPGVLAEVAATLAREQVSVATVRQDVLTDGRAQLVLTTHACAEDALGRAVSGLAAQTAVVVRPPVVLQLLD